MTLSSDRRRAELDVIAAARRYVGCYHAGVVTPSHLARLSDALGWLDELPLEKATTARSVPAVTSENAAAFMSGKRAASMNARILRQLQWTWYTVEELCRGLGGKHQTVSARVHELWRAGWLETCGTRETSSGQQAHLYRLTQQAKDAIRG